MWQVLPRDVFCVHVGPDQRIWYGTSRMYAKALQSSLKQIIEAQFREAAPEIPPVPIALFEPGGRVWFLTDENRTLLGYDGSTWVTRSLSRPNRFVGRCPGHPRREGEGYNCFFDGRAFFIETDGVCSFDGKEWSFQSLLEPEARRYIFLQTVPGEGELIATVTRMRDSEFWRWREGQWAKVDLPVGEKQFLAPWSGGRWWVRDSRGLRLAPPVSGSETIGFDRLFQQMKETEDAKAREAFADELLQCPDTTYKKIEQALSATYDPEVIKLLLSVRERLSSANVGLSLGSYVLKDAWLAHNDLQGTVFIVSAHITESGRLAGPGLVVAEITGNTRLFRGESFAHQAWHASDLPLYDKRQDIVWLASWSGRQVRWLDLRAGGATGTLPSRSYRQIRATAGDGSLFVSVDNKWQKSPIVVFRPGAPDDRRVVEPKTLLLNGQSTTRFRVSPDGIIWADLATDGLAMFDGRHWKKIVNTSGQYPLRGLTVGGGRETLAHIGDWFVYVTPNGIDEDGNVQKLIARNRERIRKSFSLSSLSGSTPGPLVVDGAGNIWFTSEQDFWVLAGDDWLDVKSSMREAGLGGPAATVPEYVLALAEDDSVLLLPRYNQSGVFKTVLARAEHGRVVLEQGPDVADVHWGRGFLPPFVRDRQGGLWLPRGQSFPLRQVTRLAERGDGRVFDTGGLPVFCDASGHLWLFSSRRDTENCYRAYPGRNRADELRLPRGDLPFRLVDGRPGSIYACSSEEIYHLRVRSDAGRAHLDLVETYVPGNIEGRVSSIESSQLGYIVMCSYTDSPPQWSLHLLPFPEAASASRPGANERG